MAAQMLAYQVLPGQPCPVRLSRASIGKPVCSGTRPSSVGAGMLRQDTEGHAGAEPFLKTHTTGIRPCVASPCNRDGLVGPLAGFRHGKRERD